MVKEVQFRRGSTADHTSGVGFTGVLAEVTVDTTNKTLRVHDGVTKGGNELVGVAATQTITNKTLTNPTINIPTINGSIISGVSTISNGTILIGSGTSTGTVSQPLQVTGGSYISGNLGIGTTNPSTKLDVIGIGEFLANGATLNLIGTDHTYIQWYPDGVAAGRKAYTGFSGASNNYFTITNEISDGTGHINLDPGTNAAVLIKTTSETGTASQNLQVSGGAYISGNLGIGTTNPSTKLDVAGEITVRRTNSTQEGGQITFTRAIDDASAYSIDVYNDVGLGLTAKLRFIDNVAGAERAAIDKSGNFLIGTGTSTGTTSQPLQVNGGAYFSSNVGIASTNPTAELHIVGPGSSAATSAPFKITVSSPTLLATPESGAFEYDNVLLYHTNNDTTNANQRALIPEIQFIRRPDNLSISDTTSPGTSFFGATNRPALLGGYIYEVEAVVFITKVTNNGTITLQASLSTGNFTFATLQANTSSASIVVGGTTSPVNIFTSATLTAATSHGVTIKGLVQPASNSRFDLLIFNSANSVTALANSYMKVTCVGTGTTIGNFG